MVGVKYKYKCKCTSMDKKKRVCRTTPHDAIAMNTAKSNVEKSEV